MTARRPRDESVWVRVWETVNEEYELEYEPAKVEILLQACRVADVVAGLERAAAKDPLTVQGSGSEGNSARLSAEIRVPAFAIGATAGPVEL